MWLKYCRKAWRERKLMLHEISLNSTPKSNQIIYWTVTADLSFSQRIMKLKCSYKIPKQKLSTHLITLDGKPSRNAKKENGDRKKPLTKVPIFKKWNLPLPQVCIYYTSIENMSQKYNLKYVKAKTDRQTDRAGSLDRNLLTAHKQIHVYMYTDNTDCHQQHLSSIMHGFVAITTENH